MPLFRRVGHVTGSKTRCSDQMIGDLGSTKLGRLPAQCSAPASRHPLLNTRELRCRPDSAITHSLTEPLTNALTNALTDAMTSSLTRRLTNNRY